MQRCMDVNQQIHACIINYNKAFSILRNRNLIQLLRTKNTAKDTRKVIHVYLWQFASIKVGTDDSKEIKIQPEVRQE